MEILETDVDGYFPISCVKVYNNRTSHVRGRVCLHKHTMSKADYRHSDVARLIMSRVHARPRAERSSAFNLSCARAVLEAFDHRSIWNNATEDLTIVRISHEKPLDIGNAMVLQVREANRRVPDAIIAKATKIAEAMYDV